MQGKTEEGEAKGRGKEEKQAETSQEWGVSAKQYWSIQVGWGFTNKRQH